MTLAERYLNKRFIGQERIKNELPIIMEEMKDGINLNLLFRAPSGWGKTRLVQIIYNYADFDNTLEYNPSTVSRINTDKRIHIIDEVHLLDRPEFLYSYMDSGEHSFLFSTNVFMGVLEPVRNRCIEFNFDQYQHSEISKIVSMVFSYQRINVNYDVCSKIALYSRSNPRVAKNLSRRLCLVFKHVGIPRTPTELSNVMLKNLGLKQGGYTELDNQYLETLNDCGGLASLTLISNSLNIDKATLTKEIEPFLIMKKRITITNKGRMLL